MLLPAPQRPRAMFDGVALSSSSDDEEKEEERKRRLMKGWAKSNKILKKITFYVKIFMLINCFCCGVIDWVFMGLSILLTDIRFVRKCVLLYFFISIN